MQISTSALYESLNASGMQLPADICERAAEYQKLLEDLLHHGKKIPVSKIEEIQDFADDIEVALLKSAREKSELLKVKYLRERGRIA